MMWKITPLLWAMSLALSGLSVSAAEPDSTNRSVPSPSTPTAASVTNEVIPAHQPPQKAPSAEVQTQTQPSTELAEPKVDDTHRDKPVTPNVTDPAPTSSQGGTEATPESSSEVPLRHPPLNAEKAEVTPPAAPSEPAPLFKAGTYSATVNGHNAPFTVTVTVSRDRIEKIDTSDNLETTGVGRVAIEKISQKIVDYQSLGVDSVTGATISSFALREGVKSALKSAGADIDTLTKKVESHPIGKVDIDADVIVVGGGGAGLAAAISAYEAGARKVLVLEKLGFLGGSTNVSEGALNAPDPERQGKMGIDDSIRHFTEQTLHGGHDKGDPVLVRHLTKGALDAVHWLEMEGVHFKDEIGTATGALWQRSHYPSTPSGNTYIRAFEERIAQTHGDIEVITDAQVIDLVENKRRITGVVAKNFGRTINAHASHGVIIATGGFGANVPLRQKVNTGVWKDVPLDHRIGTTNLAKAAQGEGLTLAEKRGADVVGLDDIQLHPCGTPGTGLMEHLRTSGRNRIFVNTDGERFVNEGAARDVLAKAIFAQKGAQYWIIVNHLRYPSRDFVDANGSTIRNMVAMGAVVEAGTLEELAQKTHMDPAKLKASVDAYNRAVDTKLPDALGFVANNKDDRPMTEGPWYAAKKVPTVHHTMGGLRINERAQVLNTKGEVIPGLYAAGEVTGGIHGSNRLGGNAIADVMVFGRTAGTNAVLLK